MPVALVIVTNPSRDHELADAIERIGGSVMLAENIGEAIRLCRTHKFDWIIGADECKGGLIFELMLQLSPKKHSRFAIMVPEDVARKMGNGGQGSASRIRWIREDLANQILRRVIRKAHMTKAIRKTKKRSQRQANPTLDIGFGQLLGNCPAMHNLYELVTKSAPTDATVLLVGESGTGKDLVAQEIHQRSQRSSQPYVAVNCGAIPENLMESELLGHEKGAFTGATRAHKGVFERAHGGTLFLDEVTEMPIELQVKLLRVLETGVITRVGSENEIRVDVRIIAATNRKPGEAVADAELREDLLYRLSVFPIEMPPLRNRGEDVVQLAKHYINLLNAASGESKTLSDQGADRLRHYHWPGNVRQLRNIIQRQHIMAESTIDLEELDRMIRGEDTIFSKPDNTSETLNDTAPSVGSTIADAEQKLILATLESCGGDKKLAAKQLGISVKTIYNRLKQYQVHCA